MSKDLTIKGLQKVARDRLDKLLRLPEGDPKNHPAILRASRLLLIDLPAAERAEKREKEKEGGRDPKPKGDPMASDMDVKFGGDADEDDDE